MGARRVQAVKAGQGLTGGCSLKSRDMGRYRMARPAALRPTRFVMGWIAQAGRFRMRPGSSYARTLRRTSRSLPGTGESGPGQSHRVASGRTESHLVKAGQSDFTINRVRVGARWPRENSWSAKEGSWWTWFVVPSCWFGVVYEFLSVSSSPCLCPPSIPQEERGSRANVSRRDRSLVAPSRTSGLGRAPETGESSLGRSFAPVKVSPIRTGTDRRGRGGLIGHRVRRQLRLVKPN